MKTGILLLTAFALVLVPAATQSFAEGSFDGHSSIDPPLSEVVSGQSTTMTIRFLYTSGPYALNNFAPIIEVNPSSAGKFVKVEVDPLEITQGQIKRIPVTLTVDPRIEHEKIFLSISYAGNHFMSGDLQKSSWNDQIELDVKGRLVPEPGQGRPVSVNCGPGTTLQDGICVADKTTENHMDSDRWGSSVYVKSPLRQFKSGILFDEIQCKDGLVNIIKISNGLPGCVKPDTKEKLMQRGWATEPMFYGLTKPQITDIQHAKLGCKKTGNQTYCNEMIQDKIEYYLQQNALDTNPESVTENCEECKLYGCAGDEVYFRGICMIPEAKEKAESIGETEEPEPSPEPEPISDAERQLYDARKSLKEAYQNHVDLGPYHIQDVVVGFGIEQKGLTIDIGSEYVDSESIDTIKEEIQRIVGNNVKINYVMYDEPIERHIETVIPYLWNKILHQNKIDFAPKNQTYWNNADGFTQHDKVCSPFVTPNGTEFYISSTFNLEPFEMTGTYIDKTQPDDCHKIWKTDVLMKEPDRVTALWLENEK